MGQYTLVFYSITRISISD